MTTFDQMLRSATMEPVPQRLLFVFATVELPPEASEAQRTQFAAGRGGVPVPLMCVDKAPQEIASFAALSQEAQGFGPPWSLLFAASLAGSPEDVPTSSDAEKPLEKMVEAIRRGDFSDCIIFDAQGEPLQLGA
ncbi:MAG: ribonucleotide reductase subunit alpha [Rhodoferax sp.]